MCDGARLFHRGADGDRHEPAVTLVVHRVVLEVLQRETRRLDPGKTGELGWTDTGPVRRGVRTSSQRAAARRGNLCVPCCVPSLATGPS
jgi:hypothetical protein